MEKKCEYNTLFVIMNTIILGILASFSHFDYELSGNSIIVGLFNPINESVWDHLKFMFFPNLLWWIIMYYIQKRYCEINLKKWIIASAISLVIAPLMVIFMFYSYTGALGIESVIIDIALVFICYYVALKLALHIYLYVNPNISKVAISIFLIALIFFLFIIFTFNPPHYPIFFDTTTGTYGIQ